MGDVADRAEERRQELLAVPGIHSPGALAVGNGPSAACSDQVGTASISVDPKLDVHQAAGGPTPIRPLKPSRPEIDAGNLPAPHRTSAIICGPSSHAPGGSRSRESPVLLPGRPESPDLSLFLEAFTGEDLRPG